ncbi:MAG: hypothetical protein HBSAPP03_10930 [Phycisphaerae bacterium]|nr:MAG: hypothetical protein HBSAPP03_10930 [Phycisphaerae bacterium]
MKRALTIAAVLLAPSLATAQPDEPKVRWLREHAAPFEFDKAGRGLDDLASVRGLVGDARIVSLGEPTHGTRECFQFKHRLVEYLVRELGFSIFAIEANMPEADRLTSYVLGGEGDPRALIAGMYFWTWDTEEVLAMVEWMRGYNAAQREAGREQRITFTGFDMQTEPIAMANARAFVERVEPAYLPALDAAYAKVAGANASSTTPTSAVMLGEFPAALVRGKRVTLSGLIRTAKVAGYAGLWWRADGPRGALAFNNMQDRGIRGDSPWARHEFTLDIPDDTQAIYFGMLLVDAGEAWFDDLSISIGTSTYRDPEAFDLGFEGPGHAGFTLTTPGTRAVLDRADPGVGRQSLKLAVPFRPAGEIAQGTSIDAYREAGAVLAHLEAHQDEYAKAVGARDAAWGVHNARIVVQCMANKALMDGDKSLDLDKWNRDASMAANVAWLADQNPGARLILWAHNGHVGRSQMAMGHYLEKRFPGQMVVVGFATGTGEYQAIGDGGLKAHPLLPPRKGTLEWHLDAVGHPRAIFDLRGAVKGDAASGWLREPIGFRLIGALAMPREQFFPRIVADEYDLMVWQRATTRARPLGGTIRGE